MDNRVLNKEERECLQAAMKSNMDFMVAYDATRTYGEKTDLELARKLYKIAQKMAAHIECIEGLIPEVEEIGIDLRVPVMGLAAAYGPDEPEYTEEDIEYRNPYYGMQAEIIASYELERLPIQEKNNIYTLLEYDGRDNAPMQNACIYIKAASQKDAILRAQMEWENICEYNVPEWYDQEKIELSLYTFMSRTKGEPIWTNHKK